MKSIITAALLFTSLACIRGSAQTSGNGSAATTAFPADSNKNTPQAAPGDQKDWPDPVNDEQKFTYFLLDLLEYQPNSRDSSYRWDAQGWSGGDYNRIWFKSEGEGKTALKADYDIDLQVLYGRFVKRYYDLELGVRAETQTFHGASVTRAHAVIGLAGLVPYKYEIEPTLFVSQKGDISARFTATKDVLVTQRLILQPRIEMNAAVQRVERFTTGRGLNNVEMGLRVRYEFRRQFAPYVGISFDRSFFGTADLVRQDGGNPRQLRFVAGVRVWH